MDEDLENWIIDFQKNVTKYFGFLLDQGFKRENLVRKYFEYPQDKEVEINFVSEKICVSISWFIIYQNIGISILEMQNGKIQEKYSAYGDEGLGQGIILYDLVEYVTNGKVKRPLPEILPQDSTRVIMKKVRESEKLINDNFEKIIEDYANLLKDYAMDILAGDLTIFPKVQEFSKKKVEGL